MKDPKLHSFLIYVTIFIVSIIFKLFPPKHINAFYGYRTSKSMENQKIWDYANKIFTNALFYSILIFGLILIIVFLINIDIKYILLFEAISIVVILLGVILFTEIKLKKIN
ncbi:MAG: SdpI family protein [Bacteroidota bacterium]